MKIIGSGSALPKQVVTNDDLCKILDTSDEWIVTHTGISSRRILKDETVYELGALAAKRALEEANADAESVDLMICSNVISDHVTPAPGCFIAGALGYTGQTLDINGACTGFLKALDAADSAIRAGKARRVLIIAAEQPSALCDWTDRSSCILFGDGAAAAVYQATEDETVGILSTFTAADGSGAEYLHMEALPVEDPLSGDRTVDPKARFLKMQGAPVVRFTARAVPLAIDTALKRAGVTAEEIDWVVPHQANLRILDVIARRYHLPKEKIYVNMDRFGNTSSASVPICLNEMRKNGLLHEGQTIVCTGFGGGLTYGAFVLKL